MADFKKALKKVLKWEGGWYSGNLVGDPNPTMKGITLTTYRTYYGKTKTANDLKNIKDSEVETIYRKLFWDKMKGDKIENQSVAEIIFDFIVNSGVGRLKDIQTIIGTKADGIVGNKTISALNGYVTQAKLFDAIWKHREQTYNQIVAKNPSKRKFLKGWLNRLNDYKFSE